MAKRACVRVGRRLVTSALMMPNRERGVCAVADEPTEGQAEEFLVGYAHCMLWANTTRVDGGTVTPEDWQDSRDPQWQVSAFDTRSQASMREDCERFISANWSDLRGLDMAQCGHDFALTRNGSGTGFWGRGLGDRGERLTEAAHAYGESTAWTDEGDALAHLD